MIDFFGSDGFFDFCMSASEAFPLIVAVLPPMGAATAASKGFLRESLSLLCTKSKASMFTNFAYAWSAMDPDVVPFVPLAMESETSDGGWPLKTFIDMRAGSDGG